MLAANLVSVLVTSGCSLSVRNSLPGTNTSASIVFRGRLSVLAMSLSVTCVFTCLSGSRWVLGRRCARKCPVVKLVRSSSVVCSGRLLITFAIVPLKWLMIYAFTSGPLVTLRSSVAPWSYTTLFGSFAVGGEVG